MIDPIKLKVDILEGGCGTDDHAFVLLDENGYLVATFDGEAFDALGLTTGTEVWLSEQRPSNKEVTRGTQVPDREAAESDREHGSGPGSLAGEE